MMQMSLFELEEENSTEGVSVLGYISDNQGEEKDYLQRGEKILTLLRNKKHKEFKPSGLFDGINIRSFIAMKSDLEKAKFLKCTAIRLLKQKWIKACDSDDISNFFTEIGISNAKIFKLESYESGSRILKQLCSKKDYCGAVKIIINENDYIAPIGKAGLSDKRNGRMYWIPGLSDKYTVVDVSKFFWEEYLMNCMKDRVQLELSEVTEVLLMDNVVADFLSSEIQSVLTSHLNPYQLVKISKEALEEPYIYQFLTERGIPFCEERSSPIHVADMLPLWFMKGEKYIKGSFYYQGKFIVKIFELLYEVYSGDKLSDMFLKSVAEDYAKVYQTKKNIPEKVIKAMSKSGFNEYFGYVEFDSDCDLKCLAEIEKEFVALQAHVFHQNEKKQEVSLRFRKLGRHKAGGLYFPTLKCLCVDVRSPSSMAHEYGHMLDYENNSISRGVRFSAIRVRYKELLETYLSTLSKDSPLRMRLDGNTKYNKNYYLEPTEIFARSLEMYLVRVLKIDNSLVKPDGGFAYPEDDDLMQKIAGFYDEFFGVSVERRSAAG